MREILLHCFWFVKDNSINSTKSYLQFNNDNTVLSFTFNFSITTSEGKYERILYSEQELHRSFALVEKVPKLFLLLKGSDDVIKYRTAKTTKVNFYTKNKNRLQRAFSFLLEARVTTEPTMKISMYMTLLECLFTSNNSEVQHQLSERCAVFVGQDTANKISIYELVKEGYGLRSSLFHGNKIKQNDEEIMFLSKNIDSLVRKIFNKIVDEESEVFLKSENNTTEFNQYFRNLLF